MNTSNRRLARADGGANVARLREVMGGSARLGADLRDQRLRQGRELADAAARLRIGTDYLGAMEEGRFDDLPGRVYAVGFLRSYAEFLGLDGALFVERLRTEGGGPTGPIELSFPEPMAPPSLPTGRILAVTLVLAVVVVFAWMRVQDGIMSISDPVEPVPAELVPEAAQPVEPAVAAVPAEAVPPASPPADAAPSAPAPEVTVLPAAEAGLPYEPPVAAEPEPAPPAPSVTVPAAPVIVVTDGIEATAEAPVATTPATTPTTTATTAPTTTPTTTATTAPTTTPTTTDEATPIAVAPTDYVPTVYGRGNAGRVELRATEETWIQVTAADGATVFTRVLRPGDAYRVPDRAGLSLRTGNAGGLEVVVDGAALGPLGGLGEIRRGIALDPDSLKAGTAGGG